MIDLFTPFSHNDIKRKGNTESFDSYGKTLSLNQNFYFSQERSEIKSLVTLAEPIIDITSDTDEKIIRKYNLKINNTILIDEDDEKMAQIFKELESLPNSRFIPGGSAQNTLKVLAWIFNMEPYERKDYRISIIGAIGDDIYKDKIEAEFKELGINPIFEVLKGDKTSRVAVAIYNKEKSFVSQIRASKRLTEEFVEKHLKEILEHKALFIEGYMVSKKFNICKMLSEYFIKEKKLIVLSLSACFIVKFYQDKLIELANDADIISGNMEEAIEFAGYKPPEVEDIFKIIFDKLKPKNNRIIVITNGEEGAYWGKYNYEEKRLEHIIRYFAYKLKDEDIQDLNGSGDAFLGGFLSRYMKGYSVHDCSKIGIKAATVILKHVGCTFPKNHNILTEKDDEEESDKDK